MAQAAQIVGALLILSAYALAQFRVLDQHRGGTCGSTSVGAGALTVLARHERQWGFFLLEGARPALQLQSSARRHRPARTGFSST